MDSKNKVAKAFEFAAFDDVLCGWRLERLRLGHSLYDLGDAAGCAGAAYVSVDEGVARLWGGTMS